jgi:hypothetical protein
MAIVATEPGLFPRITLARHPGYTVSNNYLSSSKHVPTIGRQQDGGPLANR